MGTALADVAASDVEHARATIVASVDGRDVSVDLKTGVSVAFSHVLGTPPITEPDKNLASVGWRVYRNWSLETTVGDRGRALFDAIWQHRY